jgi:hypothetical protein
MSAVRIHELFSGLVQHFPTTMIAISLVGGLALGRVAWVIMGGIGVILAVSVFLVQLGLRNFPLTAPYMAMSNNIGILQACAMAPNAVASTYQYAPSMWVSVTTFFLLYILHNAINVYKTPPSKNLAQETFPVQHRKSVGVISILATVLLLLVLLFMRTQTSCESIGGFILGILLGSLFAGIYYGINAMKSPLLSDVHGVMMGIQTGTLRTHPLACAPRAATTAR